MVVLVYKTPLGEFLKATTGFDVVTGGFYHYVVRNGDTCVRIAQIIVEVDVSATDMTMCRYLVTTISRLQMAEDVDRYVRFAEILSMETTTGYCVAHIRT